MKIAMVSAASSIHTVKWVRALIGRGHEVCLFSLLRHPLAQGNEDIPVCYVGKGKAWDYTFAAKELKEEIINFSPDIINVHYASGYGSMVRYTELHPVVLSVWGSDVYDFPQKSFFHRRIIEKNLRFADVVASTSHVMAKHVKDRLGYKKEIVITPFGVDTSLFIPSCKEEGEPFTVGIIKALEPKYGVDYLVDGFAKFLTYLPAGQSARLLIYGKGSCKEALAAKIEDLELCGCIRLMGHLPNAEIPEAICRMDVCCLPSILESFGVAAVEAMACSVPVIASDVDGFLETMEDGVTGFIIPKENSDAIAEKLFLLYNNEELRRQMGKSGRQRVLRLYDFSENVKEMEQAYTLAMERFHSQEI